MKISETPGKEAAPARGVVIAPHWVSTEICQKIGGGSVETREISFRAGLPAAIR